MKFVKIEGEITAQAYKRLMAKLRGLNRKQLLECFDHYFCHVIETNHVDEFLKILNDFENCAQLGEYDPVASNNKVPVAAAVDSEISFVESDTLTDNTEDDPSIRPQFQDTLTEDEIRANADFLDIMFDETYFEDYLYPEAKKTVAEKLINFAKNNELPVQAHWENYK
jgi:hypothetical protein